MLFDLVFSRFYAFFYDLSSFSVDIIVSLFLEGREGGGYQIPVPSLNLAQIPVPRLIFAKIPVTKFFGVYNGIICIDVLDF